MKSELEIRTKVEELWKVYQNIDWESDPETLDHRLDLALAKYEALAWVFED